MANKLSMRVIASFRKGPKYGTGTPFQYEVDGLPDGQQAWIADFKHEHWRILRARNGVSDDWSGDYSTAAQALLSLQEQLDKP